MTSPPIIELGGSLADMGRKHGQAVSDRIKYLAAERIAIILSMHQDITTELIRNVSESVLQYTATILPDVVVESQATARAAGIDHWELLVAGGFSDILDNCLKAVSGNDRTHECTVLPVTTNGGRTLLAGTWDTHASAQDALVVVRRAPTNAPATLALSTAGWPMQQGVTSSGLAFCIANLAARESHRGTSYICALPTVTAFRNAASAAHSVSRIAHCSARYYAFLDATGSFRGIETDGSVAWTLDKHIAHTNHFILPDAMPHEGRPFIVESSEARRTAGGSLLSMNHDNGHSVLSRIGSADELGSAICQTGRGRQDRTCATFVLDPVSKSIVFTVGPPSGNDVINVTL